MTRQRVAIVLGVVAVLAVLATTGVAVATYVGRYSSRAPDVVDVAGTLTVRDPATGASFEVPAIRWTVEDRSVRIYYTDERDRPMALVRGPAVYRAGYCADRPKASNRAFAGFTRQSFDTWVEALDGDGGQWSTGVDRERIELADGTAARLSRVGLFVRGEGPCSADGVEVAMVETGDARVVLVRDTGEEDTLPGGELEAVLSSLRLQLP